jgi:phage/plasmid-associated DNA primase
LVLKFDKVIAERERKSGMAKAIIDKELGAIISKALIFASATVKRGHYIEPPSSIAARKLWNQDNNPLLDFIENTCTDIRDAQGNSPLGVAGTAPAELYMRYTAWCVMAGISKPLTLRKFIKSLGQLGYEPYRVDGFRFVPLKHGMVI